MKFRRWNPVNIFEISDLFCTISTFTPFKLWSSNEFGISLKTETVSAIKVYICQTSKKEESFHKKKSTENQCYGVWRWIRIQCRGQCRCSTESVLLSWMSKTNLSQCWTHRGILTLTSAKAGFAILKSLYFVEFYVHELRVGIRWGCDNTWRFSQFPIRWSILGRSGGSHGWHFRGKSFDMHIAYNNCV